MTVQRPNPAAPYVGGRHRIIRLSNRHRARPLRHRVVVLAPDPADAVRYAGGWLFDQVTAGWDALVLTADHSDPRPLHILGARPIDLECALSSPVQDSWPPRAIAVGARLCGSDGRVRRIVRRALDEGTVDVRLWDDRADACLRETAETLLHPLSTAARAFKAEALAAASVPAAGPGGATETFYSGRPLRSPRGVL